MDEIRNIIQSTLENETTLSTDSAEQVARVCAQKLTRASLNQLSRVIGGTTEYDYDGQAIIYTGIYYKDD